MGPESEKPMKFGEIPEMGLLPIVLNIIERFNYATTSLIMLATNKTLRDSVYVVLGIKIEVQLLFQAVITINRKSAVSKVHRFAEESRNMRWS